MTVDRFWGNKLANCILAIRRGTPASVSNVTAGNIRYERSEK